MTHLKVLTDSSCDMPPEDYARYDIGVVPINIHFGAEDFLEGVNIDQAGLFRRIAELGLLPKTSQPSVGQFVAAYREWARRGYDTLLSVHVASTLSGTVSSARLAAREVAGEIRVLVFDSLSGSAAMGMMCQEAVQLARAGLPLEQILARLEAARRQVRITLTLATLKYAQLSGRVSNFQSLLASMLNIKPIIALHEGRLLVEERIRTRQAALDRLLERTCETAGRARIRLAVIHGQACQEAETLLARARERLDCGESFVADIAASLAVHFGPGVIGTVVYPLAEEPPRP